MTTASASPKKLQHPEGSKRSEASKRSKLPELAPALRPFEGAMKLAVALAGPSCEAVLHDLSDPMHSVVRVENGVVTGRAVGQGLRHLVPSLLTAQKRGKGADAAARDLLPPYWIHHKGKLIRALSLLIRDDAGEVAGVLCINQDVSGAAAAAPQLEMLMGALRGQLPPAGEPILEDEDDAGEKNRAKRVKEAPSTQDEAESAAAAAAGVAEAEGEANAGESVLKTVFAMIDRMTAKARSPKSDGSLEALSREARHELVAFMETRGVFLVKGALEYAADRLGVSKVTLYSDLDALRRRAESGEKSGRTEKSSRTAKSKD